jgi:hypothetical protein
MVQGDFPHNINPYIPCKESAMPVSQNIGVETVKAEIKKGEENSYHSQALPTINNSPAMRGGGEGGFTTERKRRTSAPSNSSAS